MNLSEIEQAIAELSRENLSRFCAWFEEYYAQK